MKFNSCNGNEIQAYALCDVFSNKAERSGKQGLTRHCEGLGYFCGQISIKGLDVVFLKAASPQTAQGNVLDSRLRSVLRRSVVTLSVKVIVTASAPFSRSQPPEQDKVVHISPPRQQKNGAGRVYCRIVDCM